MRIVCLSAETADLCARLGAWEDVVAVSAYADQSGLPTRPVATGFSSGDAERVLRFEPDLVLGFSDVQADLAAALIRGGATVLVTNQRTLSETADAMRMIARAIGRDGDALVAEFERELTPVTVQRPLRPRVYFEEWPDPPIAGIGWVGELIERAGGIDLFADRRGKSAKSRLVSDAEVLGRSPDVIVASWCGKPVNTGSLRARFAETPAGRSGQIHEIRSADILQPGFSLVRGFRALRDIFCQSKREMRCV